MEIEKESSAADVAPAIGMSRNRKLFLSAVIWFCTFSLGLAVGFFGTSLLEISNKLGIHVSVISRQFPIMTISGLCGTTICGIIYNYLNRQVAVSFLLVLMGLATICFPLAPSVTLYFCICGLFGFTSGGYNVAQIVWIIEMWEHKAAPYIQVQHFSFAAGTLVGPLLMRPFLSKDNHEHGILKLESNYTAAHDLAALNHTLEYSEFRNLKPSPTLYVPYLIGGFASILGAALILGMYFVKKYESPSKIVKADSSSPGSAEKDAGFSKSCNSRKVTLVLLSALVLGAYEGMEHCTIIFLPSFTHFINLQLSKQDGALILSSLTGAYTVGRAIGIVAVLKVLPEYLLIGNLVLIVIGNSLLMLFANTSHAALWVASIMLGVGFSTVFPSFYGYIEKHLKVSNVVGSLMLVTASSIQGSYPIIVGAFIERNPIVLMYTNYFSVVVCTSAFVGIYCINRARRRTLPINRSLNESNRSENENSIPLKSM